MRESDLAAACARWLERQGFDVHGEVQPRAYCGRFDVVGVRARGETREVWIVETKTTLSVDLRLQAADREDFCHRVWCGVPWRSRPLPSKPTMNVRVGYPPAKEAMPAPDAFGVLYVEGDHVFVARDAPETGGRRHLATLLACTEFTRGKLGGIKDFRRGDTPTPYRTLIWTIHNALARHPDGLLVGEILDEVKPLLEACGYREPRAALLRFLRSEICFEVEYGTRRRDNRWRGNGLGVPQPPVSDAEASLKKGAESKASKPPAVKA